MKLNGKYSVEIKGESEILRDSTTTFGFYEVPKDIAQAMITLLEKYSVVDGEMVAVVSETAIPTGCGMA